MAETWFAASGPYHWLKLFESQMQSQLMNLKGTNPNGFPVNHEFYGILEPVNLYRFITPKEALPIVLKTLGADVKTNIIPHAALWAIRKAFGLREPNIK